MTNRCLDPKKRKNKHSGRKAKEHRIYTRTMIMELYGVSRNTIINWLLSGLEKEAGGRRFISGRALNAFHSQKNRSATNPCHISEIYCVSCKGKHRVDKTTSCVTQISEQLFSVSVRCPTRQSPAFKFVSAPQLVEILEHRCTIPELRLEANTVSESTLELGKSMESRKGPETFSNDGDAFGEFRHE